MKARALVYAAVALLLGAGVLFVNQRAALDESRHGPSVAAAALPQLLLTESEAAGITRIELLAPTNDVSERRIVLEKRDRAWQLTAPLNTPASTSKVQALIENLKALRVSEAIDRSDTRYGAYGLSDERAFHVRAYLGTRLLRDLYFGKNSARGQLLRIDGLRGVFGCAEAGSGSYAGYLYTRPLRSWREPQLLNFDEQRVIEVQIENPHAEFRFMRSEGGWVASLRPRARAGELGAPASHWAEFDPQRVDELVHAFAKLSADEYGAENQRESSGLAQAEQTGGVITFVFRDLSRETIRIGRAASGPSSWAIKDSRWASKSGPDATLYALALWTTDWVTSGAQQFETPRR